MKIQILLGATLCAALLMGFSSATSDGRNYQIHCVTQICSIQSDELSFDIIHTDRAFTLHPKSLTPSANENALSSEQFDIIPDDLYPNDGHYRVGPNGKILLWQRKPDSLRSLTLDQFISRVRRSKHLYIRVWISHEDAISSDQREIETAAFLSAIDKARLQLAADR